MFVNTLLYAVVIIFLKVLTIDHPCMSPCSCHFREGHLEVVQFLVMNAELDVNIDNMVMGRLHCIWLVRKFTCCMIVHCMSIFSEVCYLKKQLG